jgi:alcohol dehydrogenase
MAMKSAWLRGAERVIGVDLEPYRLEMAHKAVGVEWVNINDDDPVEKIREMTKGREPMCASTP